MSQIEVYTDGSCETDTGKGGWGVLLLKAQRRIALSGHEDKTTSNRMELTAAIKALEEVPEGAEVKLCSDSQYLVHTMTRNWKRNANLDLWERLDALAVVRRVGWAWIRGHNAHPGNEFVNALAGYAAGLRSDPPEIDRFLGLEIQKSEAVTRTVKPGTVQDSSIFSHQDEQGRMRMVDVGWKPETERIATARGVVHMRPETLALIEENGIPKGDVFAAARMAGVMGAKQTPFLIPLCHPITLSGVDIELEVDRKASVVQISATVRTIARTGVEMEALTAVTVAALTVYDMCKMVDLGIRIEDVHLTYKVGGKSSNASIRGE
jgi:cyclic pyranopterin phosphate synthase